MLNNWFKCNKLFLNFKKTKYLLCHSKRKRIPSNIDSIRIENNVIERIESINFLGILIHESLEWNHHIDNISSKLSRSIGVLLLHIHNPLTFVPSSTVQEPRYISLSGVSLLRFQLDLRYKKSVVSLSTNLPILPFLHFVHKHAIASSEMCFSLEEVKVTTYTPPSSMRKLTKSDTIDGSSLSH